MSTLLRLALSCLSLFFMTSPSIAADCNAILGGDIVEAHIHQLRPTQMEYGEALVELRANKMLREAARAGIDAHAFLIERNSNYTVPAVISPRGEFFVTDSHHGIAAIYSIGKT